jgi:hypothetical protein
MALGLVESVDSQEASAFEVISSTPKKVLMGVFSPQYDVQGAGRVHELKEF